MSAAPRSPFRAVTSSLSARSLPAVPPAAENYEPAVKAVLARRLNRQVFLSSILAVWILSAAWISWSEHGIISLWSGRWILEVVRPATMAFAGSSWVAGILPVIVLRKVHLTLGSSIASSPAQTVKNALAKPSTRHGTFVYTLCAVMQCLLNVVMAYTVQEDDPRLALFVKSKKHPYYLNGRLLFFVFSSAFLGAAFLLRNLMLDRFAMRSGKHMTFLSKSQSLPARFFLLLLLLVKSAVFSILVTASYVLLFGLARAVVFPVMFRLPLVSRVLKPFMGHYVSRRAEFTLLLPLRHRDLLVRAFMLALTTVTGWEVTENAFDGIASEPVTISHTSADPALTLISGTTSSSPAGYFQLFAYTELLALASDDSAGASARRTALFGDQKHSPSMWATLCRSSLLLLGHDYQLLLRRGAPAPPPAPAAAPAPPPKTVAPGTPLKKGAIFKAQADSPLRRVVEGLASDGAVSTAVGGLGNVNVSMPEVGELVKRIEGVPDVRGMMERARQRAMGWCPTVVRDSANDVEEWWVRDRLGRRAEACLPHRQLDAVVVEVLSHLVCASLTEDRYGVVQRDIPRILEAFVSFLSAVEDYQKEMADAHAPAPLLPEEEAKLSLNEARAREAKKEEFARACECTAVVNDALKDGMMRITRTFGDKLAAFKFPARIARRLQGFADYA